MKWQNIMKRVCAVSFLNESFNVHFREKAELWQKADDMEHEIKLKADDRWMDDSEVSHCLGCKTEFSFLLRKVCVANSQCRVCTQEPCGQEVNSHIDRFGSGTLGTRVFFSRAEDDTSGSQ